MGTPSRARELPDARRAPGTGSARPSHFRAPEASFTLAELRAAIPERCLRPSPRRSLAYLVLDLGLLALLYAASLTWTSWALWPLFAFGQGTLFWSLFVIGHDCGHGSFSGSRRLNDAIGHLVHTPLLVPYHGWRLSHRRHHRFAGHADRDEAWQPLTEGQYRKLPRGTRLLRYRLALFALPFYLLRGTPSRGGSHFDPASPIFGPGDRPKVLASSLLCLGMLSFLVGLGIALGPVAIARYYLAPYAVFAAWLGLVTLLHHTAPDVPWYRGREWTLLRGALSTVDRRYGWLEGVHHHAGHHVAHHLFPRIPHYRLAEATEAIRPVLGRHYRVSGDGIPRALLRALRECRFVPDRGDRVTFRR